MRGPGIVILVYGLLGLGGGIIGYTSTGSTGALIGGGAFGMGLFASGVGVLRGKNMGFSWPPF